MLEIRFRYVHVWSALKMGCAFQFVSVFVLGVPGLAIAIGVGDTFTQLYLTYWLIALVAAPIFGAIVWAIAALFYNGASLLAGGLVFSIREDGIDLKIPPPAGWRGGEEWRYMPEYQDYIRAQRQLRRR